jgi:hypothetical protein
MERFPSAEDAARTLIQRNRTKRSDTFYVVERERPASQTRGFFLHADRSGYMRVFLRDETDPVPGLLDTPDEEWILERGGRDGHGVVVRLPWMSGDERATVRGEFLRVDPAPFRPTPPTPHYEVRNPGAGGPKPDVCPSCRMAYSMTGRCNCS